MWQSQWHSVCHLAFESLCIFNFFSSYTRPSDQTQRPRLVLVKGPCSQPANTLHPTRTKNANESNSRNATWTIDGYEKVIKILWAHRLITKAQRMQMKAQKQQSTAPNSKNNTRTSPAYEQKSSKYCAHTSYIRKQKEFRWKCKSNKVLRTTAKMIHELLPNMTKVIKIPRARRMIRLLPERYDLNRPLVCAKKISQKTATTTTTTTVRPLVRARFCLPDSP